MTPRWGNARARRAAAAVRSLGNADPQRCAECGRRVTEADRAIRLHGIAFHEGCARYRRR